MLEQHMNELYLFQSDRAHSIEKLKQDENLKRTGLEFLTAACVHKYPYNFDWLGIPIIQFPQDIIAIQELIWKVKPNIIVETGVARGGSVILSASILHLLNDNGIVIGVDIDIRPHNRHAIEQHPLSSRIKLIEGSSIDKNVLQEVKRSIYPGSKVMVILDSNHTHEHVLSELELYSPLVSDGSYLIVMDTIIEDMPKDSYPDRPWNKGNNPKTAVHEFLKKKVPFEIDYAIQNKLQITVAPDGFLKCVK